MILSKAIRYILSQRDPSGVILSENNPINPVILSKIYPVHPVFNPLLMQYCSAQL